MFSFIKDFFLDSLPMFRNADHSRHLLYVHPLLSMVLFDMSHYCLSRDLPFTVTSMIRTPEHNRSVGAKSRSHVDGRSFDLSDDGWGSYQIAEFKTHFNKKYQDIAAISSSNNKPNLVVYHNAGSGFHFHIQINSKYSIKDAWTKL